MTATKAPAATTTATDAPPGDKVTPAPTKKLEAAKTATPAAEGTTAETAKKDAPGFTAVFAAAGMLAVAYAMMRRRRVGGSTGEGNVTPADAAIALQIAVIGGWDPAAGVSGDNRVTAPRCSYDLAGGGRSDQSVRG